MYETKYHTEELSKYTFLVTGGAGFIGSNLVEYLLKYDAKKVVILDDFSTGFEANIKSFLEDERCVLIEGDIRNIESCRKAMKGVDYVLHQAALGSVPRSINDPITTNEVNISGFLNMLVEAKDSKTVKRFVYAASSSTYGDHPDLPKIEENIGKPLSPYAVTKYVNELYADVFFKTSGLESIGLRYFNVFGPRQSPKGAYAAVIPLFFDAAMQNKTVTINGDGEQTRDFTFIENVVQANIKALFSPYKKHEVYNVACGERISINTLWDIIKTLTNSSSKVEYKSPRVGDVRDSLASVEKATIDFGYRPMVHVETGLRFCFKLHENKI